MFWWLSSEVFSNKTNFVDSSFPTFSFSFSRSNHLKHLSLSHWFNLFHWHVPLSCFFFTFLFDHVCQHFRVFLLLPVHKISWNCAFFNVLHTAFSILFLMFFDGFLHLYLLFEPFFVEKFSLDTF